MATINNQTVTKQELFTSSLPPESKQPRSLQEIFLKYLPTLNPLEALGVSHETLNKFGLFTQVDLAILSKGLPCIKSLEKHKQHLEQVQAHLTPTDNPHHIHKTIVMPLKECIEGIIFNEDESLKKSILSLQCDQVDLETIPARAEEVQKKLQELLKDINDLTQFQLRKPSETLTPLLISLVNCLQEVQDLEREKVVKEISAYTRQYAITTIWKRLRDSEITTLHQLQQAKGLECAQLFGLEALPEFNQKLVPFTDETHELTLPDELLCALIELVDRPDLLARVCRRLRGLVFDPIVIDKLLSQLSLRMGVSREDLLHKIMHVTSPYDQKGKHLFLQFRESQMSRAKALGIELGNGRAKKGMLKLENEIEVDFNEKMKATEMTPMKVLIESIKREDTASSLWILNRFKDVITTEELENYIDAAWKRLFHFSVPAIVSKMPEVVYQLLELYQERMKSTGGKARWTPSEFFLADLAKALCNKQDFDRALKVAHSVTNDRPWEVLGKVTKEAVLEFVALSLFENGEIDWGWEVANAIQVEHSIFYTLAKGLLAMKRVEEALDLAPLIKKDSDRNRIFNKGAQAFFKKGELEKALEVIVLIKKNEALHEPLAEKLAKAFLEKGELRKALIAADLMRFCLRSTFYKQCLEAFLKKDEVEEALLCVAYLEPLQEIYIEKIVQHFSNNDQLDKLLSAVSKMKEDGKEGSLRTKLLGKGSIELFEKGEIDRAWDLASVIEEKKNVKHPFYQLARKLLSEKKPDSALDIARLIKDEHDQSTLFLLIVEFFLKEAEIKPDVEIILNIARLIKNESTQSNALCEISQYLVKIGEVDRAFEIFSSQENRDGLDIKVAETIAEAFLKKREADKALKALGWMKWSTNFSIPNALIETFIKDKQLDKALEVVRQVVENLKGCWYRPQTDGTIFNTLATALAQAYSQQGNEAKAREVEQLLSDEQKRNLSLRFW